MKKRPDGYKSYENFRELSTEIQLQIPVGEKTEQKNGAKSL
jgi:hypothetical protein